MLRRVHLHGPYAAFHDGPIEVFAATVWEAVEAVTRQLRGFAPDHNGRKKIQVVGFPTIELLKRFDTWTHDIHITPPLMFGKDMGFIQTIIGTALVVASFFVPGGPASPWGAAMMMTGIGMMVGGVMQMLSPQPQLNAGNEAQERSKYLPSSQNTVAIGTPIPLLYGTFRCGGHILSLNIDSTDVGI